LFILESMLNVVKYVVLLGHIYPSKIENSFDTT